VLRIIFGCVIMRSLNQQTGSGKMNYYDEDDIQIYVDEREDEDGRLDSQANHDSMVNACEVEF